MRVVTEEQMREIDRTAIEKRGIPSLDLMERAGTAVANTIMQRFGPKMVVICVGKGNNAGDGLVVARLLSDRGVRVDVIFAVPPGQLHGDAALNHRRLPGEVRQIVDPDARQFRASVENCDVVVDAVLGTGVKGRVRGLQAQMITRINGLKGRPIVAVDVPSGLSAENLAEGGECVRADVTVTFGLPKTSMVLPSGMRCVGDLVVDDIGYPADLLRSDKFDLNLADRATVRSMFRERPKDAHKGTFGHLLIIAGSHGMGGAAAMAAQAAVRSGVGLVTVAVPRSCIPAIEAHVLSAIKRSLATRNPDFLDETALTQLEPVLDSYTAVALGPGVGPSLETRRLVQALVERVKHTLVIDADGLNALEGESARLSRRPGPTILTPHPKEMSRLTGQSVEEIQSDRVGAARGFATSHGVAVVLKGAQSVIAHPVGEGSGQAEVWLNATGNTGLSKGGSGDVLTGLIGGLAAQGLTPRDAAVAGTFWHGAAADVVAETVPEQAMTPDDVIAAIGPALRKILE